MAIDLPGAGLGNVVLEAPNDGKLYGRLNQAWAPLSLVEAPIDDNQYVRKNGDWSLLDFNGVLYTNTITVNDISDLPEPVLNEITLAENTTYLLANNINLGLNRLILSDLTVVKGMDSLNTKLTYTGTGDLFNMYNVTARVSDLDVLVPNGRVFNWASTGGLIFRCENVQMTAARLGTFTGIDSLVRFTNIAPTCSDGGMMFYGTWNTLLINVAAGQIFNGDLIDLGSALFDGITIDKIISYVAPGTSMIKGLPNSGNIRNNGSGNLTLARTYGGGDVLSGIASGDNLWNFYNNYRTPDTRSDGLLALVDNAQLTTPATTTTPVKINGTWEIIRYSQCTLDTSGRITYSGGKGVIAPFSASISLSPASGNNQELSAYFAINGVVIPQSKGTVKTSVGSTSRLTIGWQAEFKTGDYVEVFVVNSTSVTQINVNSAVLRFN